MNLVDGNLIIQEHYTFQVVTTFLYLMHLVQMEILLSKNILAFRLLPFPSNVRNSSSQTLALGITHVLNFEHIS